jgi:hypothetical protein
VLELALEAEDLLLKTAIERLELLYPSRVGVCGTLCGSVVSLTGSRSGG